MCVTKGEGNGSLTLCLCLTPTPLPFRPPSSRSAHAARWRDARGIRLAGRPPLARQLVKASPLREARAFRWAPPPAPCNPPPPPQSTAAQQAATCLRVYAQSDSARTRCNSVRSSSRSASQRDSQRRSSSRSASQSNSNSNRSSRERLHNEATIDHEHSRI